MDRIKILLAEDHVLLRETMKPLLNAQPDLEVVAEAGTAAGALEQAEALKPDVILLDITLPDRSGISLLPELRQRFPTSRVVALTMHNEPEFMRSAFAAGAAGYVLKSSVPEVLLEAIRAVYRGEEFVDPRLSGVETKVEKPVRRVGESPIARLSEREREVLISLAQGLSYQAIGDKMGVTVKTVETYRSRLTKKLGFTNRADLMRFAIETGILEDPPSDNGGS